MTEVQANSYLDVWLLVKNHKLEQHWAPFQHVGLASAGELLACSHGTFAHRGHRFSLPSPIQPTSLI